MERIVIVGAGEFSERLISYLSLNSDVSIVGMVDDFASFGEVRYNFPVIGKINDICRLYLENKFDKVLIGIGYKSLKFRQKSFLC